MLQATYFKVGNDYVVKDYIGTFCLVKGLENCPTLMAMMKPAYSGCTKERRMKKWDS
jgi:hypothetical protein